jgi:DNA-binding XRE family transcriptional regulator
MATDRHVDLKAIRRELGLSQSEFADTIGVSVRTVQSCEQGWRNPSPAVEKAALLLLIASRHGPDFSMNVCWDTIDCSDDERRGCLVYQTKQGHLCWLLSGNICQGKRFRSWEDKKSTCMECEFFEKLLSDGLPTR